MAVSEPEGALPRPAKAPCKSCPYRRDVPSGIWDASEYAKLPKYDGPTEAQSLAVFYCHQNDGKLCAGWLACHGTDHLLALRMQQVHPSAYGYASPVPVFASGVAAAEHGMADVGHPGPAARRMIVRLAGTSFL